MKHLRTISLFLALLNFNNLFSQNETIASVPYQSIPAIGVYTVSDDGGWTTISEILQQSESFRDPKRLLNINQSTGALTFTLGGGWHPGAWFSGQQSFYIADDWLNDKQEGYSSCQYFKNPKNPSAGMFEVGKNQYLGSHPKFRHTSKQVRAMIQLYDMYNSSLNPTDKATTENMIIKGLDYLIYGQNVDGSYNNWNFRPSKWSPNLPGQNPTNHNETHVYEASYALAAMCDGYMFYNKYTNLSYGQKTDLLKAINLTAVNLLMESEGCIANSNFRGLVAWSLSKAYKVTENCAYLEKAKYHCDYLIDEQATFGPCDGMWQTGGVDIALLDLMHDTKFPYHALILRGLIETFDVTPNTAANFKNRLANSIKKGINHVINYRINLDLNNGQPSGGILTYWLNINCQPVGTFPYTYSYSEDIVEPFALMAYYANFHPTYFTTAERSDLKDLLNWVSFNAESFAKPNASNFETNEEATAAAPSILFYSSYYNAINKNQKIFNEDGISNRLNYDANRITGRTVSGDFDNDGKKDDIAAFYDYGGTKSGNETRIHVWKGDNELFDYQSASGWWSIVGYDANKITDRVVVGDFDNDGFEDDIAAFYDYGNNETRIHMFIGNNGSFTYTGALGWWNIVGYNANAITGRVVVGDFFDGDGFKDDIAVFYDYGNSETRIHMFEGRGNYFSYASNYGWWNSTGYNANAITNRVVSGDFDNDNKEDDIAVFYDYGNNETRIHMFLGQNSWFYYPSNLGWWNTTGYNANAITSRVVSGNFDGDNYKDDIAVFYDYGNTQTRMHVFEGRINYFSYPSNYGLWSVSSGYDANAITGRVVVGDFFDFFGSESSIAAVYDVGFNETRIHTWKLKTNPWEMQYFGAGGNWIQCLPNAFGNVYRATSYETVGDTINYQIETKNISEIQVHPNPTNGTFNIYIPNLEEDVALEIYNSLGELVYNKNSNVSKTILDISNHPHGIYVLKVSSNKIHELIKLIKY